MKRILFGMAPVLVAGLMVAGTAKGQIKEKKRRVGSIYAGWGYNTEWYTRSNIKVSQPALGNDYQMLNVRANDHRGWDEGLFTMALSIPQYNYRLGYYFNEKQDLAFEINFDHTKYIVTDNQNIHVKGTMAGAPVDKPMMFAQSLGSYYFLNNGANFLLFNLVKRVGLYRTSDRNLQVDLTGKAGIGPVIPHVQNSLFGKANDMGFQIGGWNTGLETALRVTVMKYAYVEFAQKVDYARYSNLKVYEGRARQAFGTYELILTAGVILPTSKNNPLFTPASAPVEKTAEN